MAKSEYWHNNWHKSPTYHCKGRSRHITVLNEATAEDRDKGSGRQNESHWKHS